MEKAKSGCTRVAVEVHINNEIYEYIAHVRKIYTYETKDRLRTRANQMQPLQYVWPWRSMRFV